MNDKTETAQRLELDRQLDQLVTRAALLAPDSAALETCVQVAREFRADTVLDLPAALRVVASARRQIEAGRTDLDLSAAQPQPHLRSLRAEINGAVGRGPRKF